MTTYIQALQRESDKRWDMTSGTGSSAAHAIGYCAGWREPATGEEAERLEKQLGSGFVESLNRDTEAKRPHQAKYHRDGHATAAEADACYQQYQLDNELEFYGKPTGKVDTLHACKRPGCSEFTAGMARLGQHRHFYLCDEHRNRETVEFILESVRLHWAYNRLVEAQRRGEKNGPEVVKLTDECAAKGIILVPGGERL
jgi:hypothetical protein